MSAPFFSPAIEIPSRIDANWLFNEASRIAGVPHVPDERVNTAVVELAEVINGIPCELAAKRRAALMQLLETLVTRLNYLQDFQRYPDIAAERISRPIIVMGFPRSGTSLLHSLLSVDPRSSSPQWWEVARPSPPVGLSNANDPRIAQGHADERDFLAAMPAAVLAAHPYFDEGAHTLMECERLPWLEFYSFSPTAYWKLPTFGWRKVTGLDPLSRFAAHRRLLQHLQYGAPRRRWALKGVAHQFYLPELRATYPDAVFVWLHRDPTVCFASGMKLQALIVEGLTGSADAPALGRQMLEYSRAGLDRTLASCALTDSDLYHLRYADFIRDPIAAIETIYTRFDLGYDEAVEQAMRNWLTDPRHASDRHGRLRYSLAEFGVQPEEIHHQFDDYIRRFDIPIEGRVT